MDLEIPDCNFWQFSMRAIWTVVVGKWDKEIKEDRLLHRMTSQGREGEGRFIDRRIFSKSLVATDDTQSHCRSSFSATFAFFLLPLIDLRPTVCLIICPACAQKHLLNSVLSLCSSRGTLAHHHHRLLQRRIKGSLVLSSIQRRFVFFSPSKVDLNYLACPGSG